MIDFHSEFKKLRTHSFTGGNEFLEVIQPLISDYQKAKQLLLASVATIDEQQKQIKQLEKINEKLLNTTDPSL